MSEEAKQNARLEVVREVEEALDQCGDDRDLRQRLEAMCASIREASGEIREDLQLQMFFRTISPGTAASQQGCGANPPRKRISVL